MGHARRPAAILLVLCGLVALVHHRMLFAGETLVMRDALRFSLPSREFLGRSLAAGEIPEWFDGVALGVPFGANPVHGLAYPFAWIMALLPSPLGLDLFTLSHVLLAALGAAAFARRLGAGAAGAVMAGGTLAASGYVGSSLANGMAPLVAWSPWVAWAADRVAAGASSRPGRVRDAALLSMGFALQLLAGEPTSILIALLLALLVIGVRARGYARALLTTAIAGAASLALAAVSILPAVRLLGWSARGAGLEATAGKWSMHPARLIEWAWPLPFGSDLHGGFYGDLLLARMPGDACWAASLFVGLPVLILAVAGGLEAGHFAGPRRPLRANTALLLGSLVFVLLAMGTHTPVADALRTILPPLRLAYFPEKWIYGALVLWATLAGIGFSRTFDRPRADAPSAGRRWIIPASLGCIALLAAALAAFAAREPAFAAQLAAKAAAWQQRIDLASGLRAARWGGATAISGAALFTLALIVRPGGRLAPRWPARFGSGLATALAALAILGPLAVTHWMATPLAARRAVMSAPDMLRAVERPAFGAAAPRPRIFRMDAFRAGPAPADGGEIASAIHETMDGNVAARFGASTLSGFEPAQSVPVMRFWSDVFRRMTPLAFGRLLGVDAVVIQDSGTLPAAWHTVARRSDGWSLMRTGVVRPRAFVAPRWVVEPESAGLARLGHPGRDGDLGTISIPRADRDLRPSDRPLSPCEVELRGPDRARIRSHAPFAGYVVWLEEAAPGWSARVDGAPAPIVVADGLFRAVATGPGPHLVEFTYRTPGLRTGAAISLAAWLAWIALLVISRPRRS